MHCLLSCSSSISGGKRHCKYVRNHVFLFRVWEAGKTAPLVICLNWTEHGWWDIGLFNGDEVAQVWILTHSRHLKCIYRFVTQHKLCKHTFSQHAVYFRINIVYDMAGRKGALKAGKSHLSRKICAMNKFCRVISRIKPATRFYCLVSPFSSTLTHSLCIDVSSSQCCGKYSPVRVAACWSSFFLCAVNVLSHISSTYGMAKTRGKK